jgi:glycosyltransferase involved in cell wall biosynthesis
MSSQKVLFFDAAAGGHHGEYFENLIAGFTAEQAERSILVVHPALEESLTIWKKTTNSPIFIQFMTSMEIHYMVAAKNIMQLGRRQLEVLESYIEKFEVSSVCLMHLNLHQYALGGWQPPRAVKIAGILFNPYAPAWRSFGIKAKARAFITRLRKRLQFFLMLRNTSIYRIYLLNDDRINNLLNSWYPSRRVFETLVDPLPAALGEVSPAVNKGEGVYTFLLAGSMAERKGCLEALEAFRTLMPQCAHQVELRLVGGFRPDSQDYKVKVSEKIDILNKEFPQLFVELVDEHVSFKTLDREFANADCILAPYLNFYGSSGVLGHACRHNKPMITCRNGLLGELVTSMKIGLVVEPSDAELFAKAIHRLIKNELQYNVETARDYCRSANHVEFASTLIRGL